MKRLISSIILWMAIGIGLSNAQVFTTARPVIPLKIVKDTVHNKYAVLIKKTYTNSTKYYFVSSDSTGNVKPIAYRYGNISNDPLELPYVNSVWKIYTGGTTPPPPPTDCNFTNFQQVAYFDAANHYLVLRQFGSTWWVVQQVSTTPYDVFVVRGKNFLQSGYVSNVSAMILQTNCYNQLGNETTAGDGIYYVTNFVPPSGYSWNGTHYTNEPIVVNTDNMVYSPPQAIGWSKFNSSNQVSQTRLKISITSESGRLKLNDLAWNSWDESGAGQTKNYYLGLRRASNGGSPLTNIDVEDMRGFTLDPKVVIQSNTDLNEMYEWAEQTIHLQTLEGQNRRQWTEGNVTYSFMPPQYTFSDSHLMEFDIKFPNFTLPNGNISVMQATPKRDLNVDNYLAKGCTYSKLTSNNSKKFVYLGDDWLWNIGCPKPYDNYSQAAMDAWCSNTSAETIFSAYMSHVFNPFKDVGYVMLNFETVGSKWQVDRWKIDDCLRHFVANASALLCAAGERPFLYRKYTIQGAGDRASLLEDITYSGTLSNFINRNVSQYETRSSGDIWDVFQLGGYMNTFRDQWMTYILIHEAIVHKKFWPDRKMVALGWHDVEPGGGYHLNLGRKYNQRPDGSYYYTICKPIVPCSVMQSYAVAAHFFANGTDIWTDGNPFTDDSNYYGPGGNDYYNYGSYGPSDNKLPDAFDMYFGQAVKYAIQPFKNIDWHKAGEWAVSEVKDILNENRTIIWPDYSVDNGNSYITGDLKYPSECMFDSRPVVAVIMNNAQTQAAVFVYNAFNAPNQMQEIKVKVKPNKIETIKIFGNYATVCRVVNL